MQAIALQDFWGADLIMAGDEVPIWQILPIPTGIFTATKEKTDENV